MASRKQPSKLEMAILSLLWERGEMTAREVLEALPDGKERAYTSVLSVLQAMERKGLVGHTRRGLAHAYHAKARQEETVGAVLRDMVRDVFGGSAAGAVQHLLSETDVSERDLLEMERLVAEHRKRRRKGEEA
jgi:BlaI family transcriptional regulator, penicillinase repressor